MDLYSQSAIEFRSIGFSTECFGFHLGNPQTANLGDGRGWQNETAVLRWDYDNAMDGSCLESFTGMLHLREIERCGQT